MVAAVVVAAGATSASGVGERAGAKVFGKGNAKLKPACRKGRDDSCTAVGSGTFFINQLGDKKQPFKAPSNGRIVAWGIELGHKPSSRPPSNDPDGKSNLEFFQDLFGNDKYGKGPVGRLVILKKQGGGVEHKLVDQSPAVKLSGPFYNQETTITLDRPLPIQQGEVVGFSSLTWVPMVRRKEDGGGKAGYRQSMPRDGGCSVQAQIDAKPQKKVGSIREYGCKFDSRLFYKAYFVSN